MLPISVAEPCIAVGNTAILLAFVSVFLPEPLERDASPGQFIVYILVVRHRINRFLDVPVGEKEAVRLVRRHVLHIRIVEISLICNLKDIVDRGLGHVPFGRNGGLRHSGVTQLHDKSDLNFLGHIFGLLPLKMEHDMLISILTEVGIIA